MTLPAGFTVAGPLPTGATMATDNSGITTIDFAATTLAVGESAVNTVQVLVAPTLATGNYNVAAAYTYPSEAVIPDAVASNNASTLPVAVVTPTPMPVQLTTFTAVAVGADARLNWGTAQEVHNHHYEVERSLDGYSFRTIDTVAGKGTTALLSTYRYLDTGASTLTTNALYYRLRQVDYDGKASFSSVQAIRFYHPEAGVVLYPNPTTGLTTLDLSPLPAGDYTVQVFEATGRLVHQATYQFGQRTLPLEGLATGTYFVKVQGNGFNKVLSLSRQ